MAFLWSEASQGRFSTIGVLFACLSSSLDYELLRNRDYVFTCDHSDSDNS